MKFLIFIFQISIISTLINCAESPEQYKEAEISDYETDSSFGSEIPDFIFKATNHNGGNDHILSYASPAPMKDTKNLVVDHSKRQGLHLDASMTDINVELGGEPQAIKYILDEKVSFFQEGVSVYQDIKTKKINSIYFQKPFQGAISLRQRQLELKIGLKVSDIVAKTQYPLELFSPKHLIQLIYKFLHPSNEKKDCFKEAECSINANPQTGIISLELPELTIEIAEGTIRSFRLNRKDYLKSQVNYLDLGEYALKTKDHLFKVGKNLDQKTKNFLESKSSMKEFNHSSKFRFIDSKKNYGRFSLNFNESIEQISFSEIPSLKLYGKNIYFKKPYLRIGKDDLNNLVSLRKLDDSYVPLRQDELKSVYNQIQSKRFHLEFSKQLADLVVEQWMKDEKTDKKFLHQFTDHNINFDQENSDFTYQFFYYQKLFYNEKTKMIKEFKLEWHLVPSLRSWAQANTIKIQNHLKIDIKSFKDELSGTFLSQTKYANFVYNGSLPFKLSPFLEKTFKGAFEEVRKGTGITPDKIHMPIQIIGPVFFTPLYFDTVQLPSGTKVIFKIKERSSHEGGFGEVYLENKKSKAVIHLKNSLNLTLPDLKYKTLFSFNPDNLVFNDDNPLSYKEEKVQVLSASNPYLNIHIKHNPDSSTHETDENKFAGNLLAIDYKSYHIPKINVCFSNITLKQHTSKKDFIEKLQNKEAEISSLVKSFETEGKLPVYLIQNYSSAFHISYFFYDKKDLFKKLVKRVQQKVGNYREFKLENLKGETDYINYQTIYLSLIGSNMKNESEIKRFQDELFYLNSTQFKNKFLNYYALDKKDLNEIAKDFTEVPVYLINAIATYIETQKQIEKSSELYFFAKADFKSKKRILKDILNFYTCQYSLKEDAYSYTLTFPYQGLDISFNKRFGLNNLRVFNPFYLDEKE